MKKNRNNRILTELYRILFNHYGPQHWWPGDEPFEVIVGAILTQSAAWTNVEKAIIALKKAGQLSPRSLRDIPLNDLALLIRPSGYYNAKAIKLKAFARWFGDNHQDSLERLFSDETQTLRDKLLGIHGIGEETADSILLYAGNKPVFVIDAYTRRIIDRLGYSPEGNKYADYQALFMENLSPDVRMFNEYHALFVAQGKNTCRKRPLCGNCCLAGLCRSRTD
ncbi:MAG: endonuclease III domain-containing protein [Dehalococcoidales bacterium]|nr:endonuclease III domain-containing protein [Dehalococcoidales bacterium]